LGLAAETKKLRQQRRLAHRPSGLWTAAAVQRWRLWRPLHKLIWALWKQQQCTGMLFWAVLLLIQQPPLLLLL
jgi:hypothetical protein